MSSWWIANRTNDSDWSRRCRDEPDLYFHFPSGGCIGDLMKAAVFLVLSGLSLSAQDIDFHHRTASFTNLEGRAYSNVTLVKGDLDGLIWCDKRGSGGRICYTNLSVEF